MLWLVAQVPTFVNLARRARQPIDFLAYVVAADALRRGESPYLTVEQSQAIWRYFHQNEVDLRAASIRGEGSEKLREIDSREQQPGPYIYPPTLALLIAQLHVNAWVFAGLSLLSILGFAWLWFDSTRIHPIFLLLIIFSLDVLASLNTGNVELLLLFASLLAARLLWDRHGALAAPLIALVILIKPFYVLLFVTLGLLQVSTDAPQPAGVRRSLITVATLVIGLVLLEVARWGTPLRIQALHYLERALEYQWFVLPVAEQTPMSIWNRTPMQAFINAGMSPALAQWASLGLWLLLLTVSVVGLRTIRLTFPLAFALALVLLYWGRPVGWTFIYLEVVLVGTLWSHLQRWGRRVLVIGIIALMLSHWWALVLTARGEGMPLVTLQPADTPWETWIVLVLSWFLLMYAARVAGRVALFPQPRVALEEQG